MKNSSHKNIYLLEDTINELKLFDIRNYLTSNEINIPTKITGVYIEDFNILYVDEIIRKRLNQEKNRYLQELKLRYETLKSQALQPQTVLMRKKTLESIKAVEDEIKQIESNERIYNYELKVNNILEQYKNLNREIKTLNFEESKTQNFDSNTKKRLNLIDKFLEIASEYIEIDVTRKVDQSNICICCNTSLDKIVPNEDGVIRCPNLKCCAEYNTIMLSKNSKESKIVCSFEDDSIDNFLRAFIRYQGLQPEQPEESLYKELDDYFIKHNRPSGAEIRKLPLNSRGRRGDTNHKMLWNALSYIGKSEYYEDVNLIGHIYWGWTLPNVMHLKDRIIDKYIKTQRVFYQIPPEERGRISSLGTQYRLWRHLQLEGHECYMDEFKIAENPESLRIHNKLWKMMCEKANDPEIYYIP